MASTATTAVTDMEKPTWVTNMDKIPVQISKDEAPVPLSVVGLCLFPPCYFILLEPYCISVFFILFTLAFTTD